MADADCAALLMLARELLGVGNELLERHPEIADLHGEERRGFGDRAIRLQWRFLPLSPSGQANGVAVSFSAR
jgi:hypothetical protein